jgi:hypothetical protein
MMKHTNTKQFTEALQGYLLPIIEQKADDLETAIDAEANPFQWIVDIARSEVGYEFERNGDQEGLAYWLSGLGMNLDYTYCDIIAVSEELHGCKLTEKEADMVCARWFSFIAVKMLQYARA